MSLLLSVARSRDRWSKKPQHLELHLVYDLENSCLKQTALADPLHPFHRLLFYFQKNHKEHKSYSSFCKAADDWNQLPATLSSNSLKHSARTKTNWEASLLRLWLYFCVSTSLPSAPRKVTGLFTHWLQNSSCSWAATVREVCTLSDWSKGTSVLGKTLPPNPSVVSHFFLPCLTSACSTRMLRAAAALLHLLLPAQESTGLSRRKQGQSWPTINVQHCCFLTHFNR